MSSCGRNATAPRPSCATSVRKWPSRSRRTGASGASPFANASQCVESSLNGVGLVATLPPRSRMALMVRHQELKLYDQCMAWPLGVCRAHARIIKNQGYRLLMVVAVHL